MISVAQLRQCFLDGLPNSAQADDYFPPATQMYLPPTHQRAVSLDCPLVVGWRGAGKTFWMSALKDKTHRSLLAQSFEMRDYQNIDVYVGFSTGSAVSFPNARTLKDLVAHGYDPYDIWSAIVLSAFVPQQFQTDETWSSRTQWVGNYGEETSRLFQQANDNAHNTRKLLLFDGLDTTAPRSWKDTQALLRGLLMLTLEFRQYTNLRIKVFVRPDMLDRSSLAFPDSSKMESNAVRLDWKDTDLYGLLFQYVGNAPAEGKTFRDFVEHELSIDWSEKHGSFPVPDVLREDENLQGRLFHSLAGKSMGSGTNRGDTWKWVPNHLADAAAYVSPRSFITAIRNAVEESQSRDPDAKQQWPLLWKAINDGVRKASAVRIRELKEDFPWIDEAIKPLKGLKVPCEDDEIFERWQTNGTLDRILSASDDNPTAGKLPPADVTVDNPSALLEALKKIHVVSTRKDGRIDVPDIIRVEAGMPRRGGVPLRKT